MNKPSHLVFMVFDSKVEAYLDPIFLPTVPSAIRAFSDAAGDPKSNFSRHPGDFTLFRVGTFDQSSGIISMDAAKTNLGTALEHRRQPELDLRQPSLPLHAAN